METQQIQLQKEGNYPKKRFRAGAISATIWNNKGQSQNGGEVDYQTISLERTYKDKDGNWKYTNSLRVSDIPKATMVLQKA
jgi:hypothetical protein